MDSLTARLNEQNIETVRKGIARKNGTQPYLANNKMVTNVVTDQDHFPYSRWFRGVYYFPEPVIAEREAGWRPRHNSCYDLVVPPMEEKVPNHCFQAACSTIYPCYPEYLTKYADNDTLDGLLNNSCIIQYR